MTDPDDRFVIDELLEADIIHAYRLINGVQVWAVTRPLPTFEEDAPFGVEPEDWDVVSAERWWTPDRYRLIAYGCETAKTLLIDAVTSTASEWSNAGVPPAPIDTTSGVLAEEAIRLLERMILELLPVAIQHDLAHEREYTRIGNKLDLAIAVLQPVALAHDLVEPLEGIERIKKVIADADAVALAERERNQA